MKLEQVLDILNFHEKNSFLKIVNNIIDGQPKNTKEIDKILIEADNDLKNVDNINIAKVFELIEEEFSNHVKAEFINTTSQLDILIDILIRDGNCILKQDWFSRLYDKELKNLEGKKIKFEKSIESNKSDLQEDRKRDYHVYKECLKTAYYNEESKNQDPKITWEEQTILVKLAKELELSSEEIKLINCMIIPPPKKPIQEVIDELKAIGVIFYHKKSSTVYVADEMVKILRKVRGKAIADKYYRRVLKLLREPQINLVCKKHNIPWKEPLDIKVKKIINEGISFSSVLENGIHKEGITLTEKKKTINDLVDKGLKISPSLKGATVGDKIDNLISYFDEIEQDEKVGITTEGYEQLLIDLKEYLPKINEIIKAEFELQDENVIRSEYLLDYNIKPRDVLETINQKDLEKFCKVNSIKTRGSEILNILDAYKDTENLFIENFENIGYRNLSGLKENGIKINEPELGIKFEELTKVIFTSLGFNVNESLRKQLNTKKDKIDVILDLGHNNLIIVECKTVKERGYDKFSSISRQLKAYISRAKINDYDVIRSIVVAPEFSTEFANECRQDPDLSLSLITASTLTMILKGLKNSKHKELPYHLLVKDVLIDEDWVLKAINR